MKAGKKFWLKSMAVFLSLFLLVGLIPMGFCVKAVAGKACQSLSGCEGIYQNGFCSICDGYEPATIVSDTYYPELVSTHKNYYIIQNAGQLYWFAGLINGSLEGVEANTTAKAVLVADIDLNPGYVFTTDTEGVLTVTKDGLTVTEGWRSWTPIGNPEIFHGSFDGASHSVSGVYINSTEEEQGLFGCSAGSIKGVGVKNSYIYSSSSSGKVAGVVGFNTANIYVGKYYYYGTLSDCYNEGFVYGVRESGGVCGTTSRPVANCHNTGNVKGKNLIGGVCGLVTYNGQLTGCYNTGSVTADDSVGGVWGYNQSDLACSDCYNTGNITGMYRVGGVAGENYAPFERCYNTGNITAGKDGMGQCAGGLCGDNYDKITNCYNTGNVSGNVQTGGLTGNNSSVVRNCYSTGKVTDTFAGGGLCSGNSGQFINCYYNYSGFKGPGIESDLSELTQTITAKFPPAFKSGEIAYLLNEGKTAGSSVVWYQDVNVDASPRLSGPGVIMQDSVYYSEYIKSKSSATVVDTINKTLLTSVTGCAKLTEIADIPAGYTTQFDGLLGTGTIIKVYNSVGKLVAQYTAIVTGEVNGDGVCDVLDCALVELSVNGNSTLDGNYGLAADINEDEVIDINDYQSIINKVLA